MGKGQVLGREDEMSRGRRRWWLWWWWEEEGRAPSRTREPEYDLKSANIFVTYKLRINFAQDLEEEILYIFQFPVEICIFT